MASNEFDGVDQRLRDVEAVLKEPGDDVLVRDRELAALPGALETYWAALALVAGDVAGTVRHAELALRHAGDDDLMRRPRAGAPLLLTSGVRAAPSRSPVGRARLHAGAR
jgi:LuxR family maltose regulon positive regulatory protein